MSTTATRNSSSDTDNTTNNISDTSTKASLETKFRSILNQNCVECHTTGHFSGFDATESTNDLIQEAYLTPGSTFQSKIYQYIIEEGLRGSNDARMPKGRDPLSDSDIQAIETFINEGLE